jgi:hypothetical protein
MDSDIPPQQQTLTIAKRFGNNVRTTARSLLFRAKPDLNEFLEDLLGLCAKSQRSKRVNRDNKAPVDTSVLGVSAKNGVFRWQFGFIPPNSWKGNRELRSIDLSRHAREESTSLAIKV